MTPWLQHLGLYGGGMSITALGFWLLYILGVGAAVLAPLAGVLLYILSYHMNPEYQWWGQSVRAAGLRTSMIIVIAIVIGLVIRRPRFRGIGRQFSAPIVFAMGLVLLALASLTWGYGVSARGAYQAEKFAKVMIFVLILIRCVRHPNHYHAAIGAWIGGVLFVSYQAWGNVGIHENGRLSLGIGGPDFSESGDLAAHMVASLPLIGAMFFMARRWWSRGILLVSGALAVNTIILTRTRNALVALAAMCVFSVFSLPRGQRLKGWLAMAVGVVLAIQLTDAGWWDRMATIAEHQDASATARIKYWHAAIAMCADHPFGIGLGNFQEVVKEYVPGLTIHRSAHNTYMECLAELGHLGLALLVMTLVATLSRLSHVRRESLTLDAEVPVRVGLWESRFHLGWHTMALRTALVGYLASAAFTTRLCGEDFWILIGLAACLDNVTAYMRHQADEPAPVPTLTNEGLLPDVAVSPLARAAK
jgi:putative inorganic carbon (HCO3(-)) transporter